MLYQGTPELERACQRVTRCIPEPPAAFAVGRFWPYTSPGWWPSLDVRCPHSSRRPDSWLIGASSPRRKPGGRSVRRKGRTRRHRGVQGRTCWIKAAAACTVLNATATPTATSVRSLPIATLGEPRGASAESPPHLDRSLWLRAGCPTPRHRPARRQSVAAPATPPMLGACHQPREPVGAGGRPSAGLVPTPARTTRLSMPSPYGSPRRTARRC